MTIGSTSAWAQDQRVAKTARAEAEDRIHMAQAGTACTRFDQGALGSRWCTSRAEKTKAKIPRRTALARCQSQTVRENAGRKRRDPCCYASLTVRTCGRLHTPRTKTMNK